MARPKAFRVGRARSEYPLTKEVLEMSVARKAAHCLNWCADHYEGQWIAYNWLYQLITGAKRTLKINAKEVDLLRGRISDIRRILQDTYQKTVTTNRELHACRATIDDQDVLDSGEMEKSVERVASATRSMLRTATLINPARLTTNTKRHKALKAFYVEQVTPMIKQFKAPTFQRRCLTPRKVSTAEATRIAKAKK